MVTVLIVIMFPSSRVKLNRAALNNAVSLKLVARRKRVPESENNVTAEAREQVVSEAVSQAEAACDPNSREPLQRFLTEQMGSETVTHTTSNLPEGEPENCVGTQKAKRKKYDQSCKDFKQEGPCTRGKYHQSRPNTRSKVKLDQIKKLCNLRLRFTCCFCTESESALMKQTEVHRQVKPRVRIAQMSCNRGFSSEAAPVTNKISKKQKMSALKSGVGRTCTFRRRDLYRKTLGTRVAEGGRDRRRKAQSRGKVRSTNDPQPAAAKSGQVGTGTPSVPTGLSNNNNASPSSTGLAVSEASLRTAVGAQQKTQGKLGQKNRSPEQSVADFTLKTGNPVTEASKKIVIWVDQYPKVTLCDVAQYCDICSHNCGFVLPNVLETKAVLCFKQDMRAGFQFWPGCFGHDKRKSEECAPAKNSELSPRVLSEESVSQSVSKHQRQMKECPNTQTLSGHTTCHFLEGWTPEASAPSSASFLVGKCTNKGVYRTSIQDRDVETEDPGSGTEIRTDKRIRPGHASRRSLSTTQHLEWINYDQTAETSSADEDKISDHNQSYVELKFSSCNSLGSENGAHKKHCGQIDESRKTDAAQMASEMFTERSEVDTDDPESFTCQRVRVYFRKIKISCARTYMPWPFSISGCSLTSNASTTACPADSSPIDQSGTLSSQMKALLNASSNTTNQASHQSKDKEEQNERNRKKLGHISSYSPDSTEVQESLPSRHSDPAILSISRQCGSRPHTATVSASSTPVNEPETNCSMSSPSPSAHGLSDWETVTTLSATSSPFTCSGLNSLSATPSFLLKKVKGVELADAHSTSKSPTSPKFMHETVEKLQTFQTSCPSPPSPNSDSSHSCDSSLILPQDKRDSDKDVFSDRSQSKLELYCSATPRNHECDIPTQHCVEANSDEFMLLPLLSPVHSPQQHSRTSFLLQCQGFSVEEVNKDLSKHKMSPELHISQIGNGTCQSCGEYEHCNEKLEAISSEFQTCSSLSSVRYITDGDEEESQKETDYKDDVGQDNRSSEQALLNPKVKTTLTSGVWTEPCSSPSSNNDDGGVLNYERQTCFAREIELSLSDKAGNEEDTAEAAGDSLPNVLDEFTAFEQDILLVDVIQDDPELFENLPEQGLLKLGPMRVSDAPKTRPAGLLKSLSPMIDGAPLEFKRRLTPVKVDFQWDSSDITEERDRRPWRPQCSKTPNACLATEKQIRSLGQPDANNNHVSSGFERSQPILTVNTSHNGPKITSLANMTEFRRQKSNAYCRQYFSESLSCGFKMCRFQHVPVDGDEKFCLETVIRFTKNPMCLKKAGDVFTGYYKNNPPGVYFSIPVLLSLLWSLLKAGMVSDVFSVLSVSLAHKIVPSHEFLLALFNFVREKGLMGFIPELMQLTFKMARAGLVLSLDCLDCVKNNTTEFQHTVHPASPASVAPFPEYLNLAYSIVEIELCTKQEDWRRMGEVFRSICQFSQHPNQIERISGRIAVALLSESKDKLSLPFATFAETVCQSKDEDGLIRSFLGRIGVSLMLRYHKTHQWTKGRRVVEVLTTSKVSYSTLKGLFGNEDGASRCCLITVATELFLLSGSVEGALNALRENNWFLSSCSWPCEPTDLESRTRVLMRLAGKTSHRDTLEVLCNLPGIREPNGIMDVSRYSPLFNSHLQACVDRQILSVASDTVDFMLSKNLPVEHRVLQILLHKLGKQNLWLRAREVFRHSMSVGYYQGVSAPTAFMTLIVPCCLGEVELALAFEMFITVNATPILQLSESSASSLSITLKRSQSCESEYLSAGSRLLSAACIPQPKLTVHYTAVNASQEQVFTLDISSARRWLRHNHLWASEVWMQ